MPGIEQFASPLERVKFYLRKKHPDWSEAHIYNCAVYALHHPIKQEKRKQSENEISKPFTNQLTFDDLMKGCATIGFTK